MSLTEDDNRRVRDILSQRALRVDAELERLLAADTGFHAVVREAVRYSVNAGGKRLRPGLVMLAAEACGHPLSALPPATLTAAAAVEMIHTYSLIHDDLPAMDNDDFRRGKPTNHKVYGEAIAVLAGDALLNHAFYVLSAEPIDPRLAVELIRELGHAAGGAGMIGGQAADILSERGGRPADGGTGFPTSDKCKVMSDECSADSSLITHHSSLRLLEAIHRHKTAVLIRSCLRMGARTAGADAGRLEALSRYGENLGLAFQVVDDVLDETSGSAELGKSAGKDKAADKLTYPGLLGLDRARDAARCFTDAAVSALEGFGERGRDLRLLASYNLSRTS